MTTELKPTYGSFVLKGIAGGTQSDKFFSEGKAADDWKRVNFSVKVDDNASVFVEMMGSKSKDVKLVDSSDRKNKKEFIVPWADRYKQRTDKAEVFMPLKGGLEKEEGSEKNKLIALTPFDGAEYIKKKLKEGDSVYIRGGMNFSVYEGKGQQKFQIQNIYHTSEPVDFKAEGYEPEASFNQEIVFVSAEDDEEKNRTVINTYIIYKVKKEIKFMSQMFFINHGKYAGDEEKTEALKTLKESFEGLSFGSTIKVSGNINIYIEKVEGAEDEVDEIPVAFGGGFKAKGQETFVRGTVIRELEITAGDGLTLIADRYTEEDFAPSVNPFDSNNGQSVVIEEDDLPFS